jgi:hypothetical protein
MYFLLQNIKYVHQMKYYSILIAVTTLPDHCPILNGLKPSMSISEPSGKVKSGSSGFINSERFTIGRFEWQLLVTNQTTATVLTC